MKQANEQLNIYLYRIFDILLVGLSFFLAVCIRKQLSFSFLEPFDNPFSDYFWYVLPLLYLWWYLLYLNRVYQSYRGKPLSGLIYAIIKANIQGLLLVGFFLFFFQEYWLHRTLLLIFFFVCTVVLVVEKVILFHLLKRIRSKFKNLKHVLIIGSGKRARKFIDMFREHPEAGYHVMGILGDKRLKPGANLAGVACLGMLEDLPEVLRENIVDEVFITLPIHNTEKIEAVVQECSRYGIDARVPAILDTSHKGTAYIDYLFYTPFITFTRKPANYELIFIKNLMDLIISVSLLVLLAPLFCVIAVLIKLDSKGPVFYTQERLGFNGRTFIMNKFRTMVVGAEAMRSSLAERNEMNGPVFKVRDDPRITRVGKFLRRTSIDELPQLINVLKGDMSLIGPRPLPVQEAAGIYGSARRRHSMKPGVTGLWQVSGRNEIDFDKWMKLDLEYVDHWSLRLDMRILWKTGLALLTGKGAY